VKNKYVETCINSRKNFILHRLVVTTDYLSGFQYENGVLQFFPHAEGYVKHKGNNQFIYAYQYKDHLGNVRLSYADINGNGTIEPATEILEENNYYPFGLKHKGYNEVVNSNRSEAAERYKFNGMEWQPELGLDVYDFGARNYDAAIGRWLNIDPLAENSRRWTPYNYAYNNPIYFVDPDGMQSTTFDAVKDYLTFNNGYYDIEFGEFAGAADHSGFYPNSKFGKDGTETVIITGPGAKQATEQLNKSTNLKITSDNTGKLSATGNAKNAYDKALQSAIDDPNITVNLETVNTESITLQDGSSGQIYVGAYGGSVKNADGSVDAYQYVNMNHVEKIEKAGVAKQGNIIGHELNENFFAAQYNNGNNPINSRTSQSSYSNGHGKAMNVDRIQEPKLEIINGSKYLIYPNAKIKLN